MTAGSLIPGDLAISSFDIANSALKFAARGNLE
jgi:hypothetical protein